MTEPISRRTVVRTTAHAAWVAPTIAVAAAVPAYAATGPANLSVAVTQATANNTNPDTVSVLAKITNTNTMPSTALTVRLTLGLGNSNQANLPTATAAGYTPATVVGVPVQPLNPTNYTFDFVASDQVGGNTTKDFSAVVSTNVDLNPSGQVIVAATPGGTGTAGSNTRTIS